MHKLIFVASRDLIFLFIFYLQQNIFSEILKMSKRPPPPTEPGEDIGVWEVNNIIDHRVNGVLLRTEFLVNWKKFGPEHNTWEPLDSVYKCPILLKDMDKNKRARNIRRFKKKLTDKKKVSKETLEKVGNFKEIKKTILDKFKDPQEFIPVGNEKILEIMRETLSDAGNFMWEVRFTNDRKPCYVRKAIVAYYWPYEAAMFLHLQASRAPKLARFAEKVKAKYGKK